MLDDYLLIFIAVMLAQTIGYFILHFEMSNKTKDASTFTIDDLPIHQTNLSNLKYLHNLGVPLFHSIDHLLKENSYSEYM